ncbi:ABC transporter permease [Nitrosovibrio tenuis]|uniref:Iron(III) transport system permease protein n=1 Tax=Nitrosovibrio tenuis TaxID=1233 RepID=A0A1H7H4S8_9PROT|nr:iron ABC transporter permease [Nitrosovibrio tenuis]SEK45433.1 iron(III) transport system permease protein [Nitrosovibrio tenuis]
MKSEAINSTGDNTSTRSYFSRLSIYKQSGLLRWRLIPILVAAVVLIPVGTVISSFFSPASDVWQHLVETTLPALLSNTFWLAVGVACGVTLLGVSLAWFTAVCEFPGRKFFSWALLLPLAIPAYVTAFVALGLFDYIGPVQTMLREWLGPDLFWFPNVRSRTGVIVVMVLAFYPYVYLLARNAFLTQGKRSLEAAQSLGLNRTQGFFKLALPMARPWIAGGLMLALMETLADFGTVAVFNYDTFTTAIYKAWFAMFSLSAASQLASLLIVIVFAMILIEQQLRSRTRYAEIKQSAPGDRIPLAGWRAWLIAGFASGTLFFAFLLPVTQLSIWAADVFARDFDQRYLEFLWHSLLVSFLAALLTCSVALLLVYATRRQSDRVTRAAVRIATIGYALPGAVLAVGIFIPLAWLDNWLSEVVMRLFHIETGLLIQGTLATMLIAYMTRFLAVSHSPIDSAMQRITGNIDEAAMGLGLGGWSVLRRVHLPMLKGGLFTGATLVFVDVMKEMPITLMTRPFGWDTLAVRIFEMTSEGQWEQAALPAVALVLAGLLPIVLFMRQTDR